MPLRLAFDGLQYNKDELLKCEDNFYYFPDREDRETDFYVCCLCDGASESYNSSKWSWILCKNYVNIKSSNIELFDPTIDSKFTELCIKEYQNEINVDTLSWSQQSAYLKGSFSTLLGVIFKEKTVKLFAVGDTIALCFRRYESSSKLKLYRRYPYMYPDDFRRKPILISTKMNQNNFSNINKNICTWENINSNDIILMMSDAIGEWMMRYNEEQDCLTSLFHIFNVKNKGTRNLLFQQLVTRERESKRLRTDDSTILKIEFQEIE